MSAEIKDEHWPTHFEYGYYISETYIFIRWILILLRFNGLFILYISIIIYFRNIYKMNTNIAKI